MKKKSKEFWVIIGITLLIPVMVIGGLYALTVYTASPYHPLTEKETVMNSTHITFIVTNKYMYKDRVGIGINVDDYIIPNKSEFDALEFKKQYTCNITMYGWIINVNHSMSDCKENKDFNYTNLFKPE